MSGEIYRRLGRGNSNGAGKKTKQYLVNNPFVFKTAAMIISFWGIDFNTGRLPG